MGHIEDDEKLPLWWPAFQLQKGEMAILKSIQVLKEDQWSWGKQFNYFQNKLDIFLEDYFKI